MRIIASTNFLSLFLSRCKRISLYCDQQDTACFQRPSSYSYNFITLVANLALPPQGRTFFNLKGPHWYENIDFELKVIRTQPHVQSVNERFFRLAMDCCESSGDEFVIRCSFQYAQNEHRSTVELSGGVEGTTRHRIGAENDRFPEWPTSWYQYCQNIYFRFRIFVLGGCSWEYFLSWRIFFRFVKLVWQLRRFLRI